ncbi:MAG: DegV family protein [Oscillospiraceae bacterium]|nr:DegV family protein [Oscillospiraceae bacterium]
MFVFFTDTDMDVNSKLAKERGFELISMPYTLNDKDVFPYVDFEEFDSKAFYDSLRAGSMPTTSAINTERYIQYFEPHFAAGNDIFYVSFSAAMSMTFNNMDEAVAILKEKYPERKFYRLDTKGITILSLNIFYEVSEMLKLGKTPEEIIKWAETEVNKFAVYFFADDLKFFKRSGRVSGISAAMGNLIGIRPIIHINDEGKMLSIGKEKGRAKALARLVSYVDELGDNVKDHKVIIGHTDAYETAAEIRDMLIGKFGELDCEIVAVNPTAGSHCGPNCVGVSFHAKHR